MLTNKLTWWILGILLLIVAFLLGYQSGLNGGINVGFRQAVNQVRLRDLGPRAAAPVTVEQAAAAVAVQAAAETVSTAVLGGVDNPFQGTKGTVTNPFK